MKTRKTLALAVAILILGVPVATAAPGGYQPDAIDRYLASNGPDGFQPQLNAPAQPDAVDRHVANVLRQAELPTPTEAAGGGTGWRSAALGMLGGASIVLVAFVGAAVLRGRRRLVLR